MLDARYKKAARALKLYGVCLSIGLVGAGSTVSLQALGPLLGAELVVFLAAPVVGLDVLGLLGFAVGTFAILGYATVPSESGAKTSAVVAAVSAFVQLGVAFSSLTAFLGFEDLAQLAAIAEVPFALITLMAMSRSLRHLGLYVRADEIYDRANRLFVGLVLLVLMWIGALGLAMALTSGGSPMQSNDIAMVVLLVAVLFSVVGSVMIAIAYTILVVRAGRELDELIYE